jgi:Rps23 Pro-64 3,4-dihydroxylase Tpa1-like proline 4-hydroxylase
LQVHLESVAVAEIPEVLPAECVILEEFLAPAELDALRQYVFDHEADFQLSEVISPGVTGGIVDHEYRRSRVLLNLGSHRAVVVNRIQSCWPRILSRLEHATFVASEVEVQITASNDGDFFRWHSDNSHEVNAPREITFVYFFHREPKNFRGGELRIYDSRWENGAYVPMENYRTVVPQQNQMVLFASSLAHEITPVECSSQAFADSRFTVNGWFHR